MNISQAAETAGLPTKTVRYYADIGLVEPSSRTEVGYRSYDEAAIRRLSFVRRARAFGFSIEACRELLGFYGDDHRSNAHIRKIAAERLEEIEAKQRELQTLHDELAHLVKSCRGDGRPDCPIMDYLG